MLAPSCGEPSSTTAALPCDGHRDELVELMRSGVPTYDYDPAVDLADLVQRSDAIVTGTIDSFTRVVGDVPSTSWTAFMSANSRALTASRSSPAAGAGIPTFAMSSLWAEGLGPDPLEDAVTVDGLAFLAFVTTFPAAPGGFAADVQGLVVSCAGTAEPAEPIMEQLPSDVAGLSIDVLVTILSSPVEADDVDDLVGRVDGPLMISPPNESAEQLAAIVSGEITMDGECLYLQSEDPAIRYPVVWPDGVRWNAEVPGVELPSGELAKIGDIVYGGGGYFYADDVGRIAGADAQVVAESCADGPYLEIAVFNLSSEVVLNP